MNEWKNIIGDKEGKVSFLRRCRKVFRIVLITGLIGLTLYFLAGLL